MSERALPEAFALPRGVLAQQTALAHTERSLGRHHRQSGTRERLRAASRRRRAVRLVSIVHEPARRAIEAVEKNDRNYRNATHLPAVLTYEPDPAFPPLVLPPAVLAPQHRHRRTPRSRESNPAAARCVLRLRAAPVAHPSDVLAAGRSGALEVPYSLASCSRGGRSHTCVPVFVWLTSWTTQSSPLRLRRSPTRGGLSLMRNSVAPDGYRTLSRSDTASLASRSFLAQWLRRSSRREEEQCRYYRSYSSGGESSSSGPADLVVDRLGDTPFPRPIADFPPTKRERYSVTSSARVDRRRDDLVMVVGTTVMPHERPRDPHRVGGPPRRSKIVSAVYPAPNPPRNMGAGWLAERRQCRALPMDTRPSRNAATGRAPRLVAETDMAV